MEGQFEQPFMVDTKGLCLFCLRPASVPSIQSRRPFKLILRYLKINVYKLCNFSQSFLQAMDAKEDGAVEVTLCPSCDLAANQFSALFEEMEMIRLQMDHSLQAVYDAVSTSYVRVDHYKKKMKSGSIIEMFNANLAENLRMETMKECYKKLSLMVPRVGVFKHEIKPDTSLPYSKPKFNTMSVSSSPPLSSMKRRKMPGPKSKTQVFPDPNEDSKLKMLLNKGPVKEGRRSSLSQAARELLNQTQSRPENERKASAPAPAPAKMYCGTRSAVAAAVQQNNSMEFGEEFVVKVEPYLNSVEYQDEDKMESTENQDPLAANDDLEMPPPLLNGNMTHFLADDCGENRSDIAPKLDLAVKDRPEEANKFHCSYCGKTFDRMTRLNGHLHVHRHLMKLPKKKVKGNKRFKCKLCLQFFYTFSKYKIHMKTHHGTTITSSEIANRVKNNFPCHYCSKAFKSWAVRSVHMRVKHSLQVLGKQMPPGTTEQELEVALNEAYGKHRKVVDDPDRKPYGCFYCIANFPHPSHLRLHILSKHVDCLVSIILRNKAIRSGADEEFQFEPSEMNDDGVEVQMEQDQDEEGSMLYEGRVGEEEEFENHDEEGEGTRHNDGNDQEESQIFISESFSLSNGDGQQDRADSQTEED